MITIVSGLGFTWFRAPSGEPLGRAGLIPWEFGGELIWEIGYSFKPAAWGRGFAFETASFLARYGFTELKQDFLISLIHPENERSIRVANKLGMRFWRPQKLGEHDLSTFRLERPHPS